LASVLSSSTTLRMAKMRLNPAIGLRRLNCGAMASVLKLQPPSASGASNAASAMTPSSGAQINKPSQAALPSIGTICDASKDCSRVSEKLRCMNTNSLPEI
jgi:hypothetical protein